MKKFLKIFVVVFVVSLSCVLAWVLYSVFKPLPDIAKGFNSSSYIGSELSAFDERVRKTYPVGMLEDDIVVSLQGLGFIVQPKRSAATGVRVASFAEGGWGFSCFLKCSVFWRTLDDGKISKINGIYNAICPSSSEKYLFGSQGKEAIPKICKNLDAHYIGMDNEKFIARVKALFPDGTSGEYLMEKLEGEGFQYKKDFPEKGQSMALFEKMGFPCNRMWVIGMHVRSDGSIEKTTASYGLLCR